MAFQPLNSRQIINTSALSVSIGSAAGATISGILAQIDSVMVNLASPQSLTNKTIGLTTSGLLANTLQFQEVSTPSTNPPANTLALYPKSDGHFYTLNSAGTEIQVGSAGTSPVGSIQPAMCTLTQFQAQAGVGWVLGAGQQVPGSQYEALGLNGGSSVTASASATATSTSVPITFSTSVLSTTANTNSNTTLSNIANLTGLAIGQLISGTAIPPLTTVTAISQYIFALPGTPAQYTFAVHSSTKYIFTVTAANATAGSTYTNNGQTFTVTSTITGATTLNATGTGNPLTSGILTLATGSGDATITFSAFSQPGANATAGATYTNNGHTYTVSSTITGGTSLVSTGTGDPNPSGTLTLSGGSGDATIIFTSFIFGAHNAVAGAVYTNNGQSFTVQVSIDDGLPLICTGTGIPLSSGTLTLSSGVGDATIAFTSVTGSVTMSAAATSSAGISVIFSNSPVTTNGTLTNTSPTISNLTNTTGLVNGQVISVTGMSPYATVSSVNTVAVPNFTGTVIVGAGAGSVGPYAIALGDTGGEGFHTLSIGEMPSHNHNVFWNFNAGAGPYTGYIQGNSPSAPANYQGSASDFNGGGAAHNNVQPFVAANVFIRIN